MAEIANGIRPASVLKKPTGIDGLDAMLGGGLPDSRTTLIVGGPGTGKTMLALQTLVSAAQRWGDPGIMVAFEENSHQIETNAASFGWDLPALEREKLFFLDARMAVDTISAGTFDLMGMLVGLEAKAKQMGARRIVFDSLDVMLSLLSDPVAERRELYRLHDWLSRSGMAGVITARIGDEDPSSLARFGFMQFMADCVLMLGHHVEARASLRTVRIVKYRGSGFVEAEVPLVIGPNGVEVVHFDEARIDTPAPTERVSSGVEALDEMLGGGFYRTSSVLISGAPGTAKSTLCGGFIEAACRRGERALYIGLDETVGELMRNLASIGIDLQPHLDSGLLRIDAEPTELVNPEEELIKVRQLIDAQRPSCIAIDPMSTILKGETSRAATSVAERILALTKRRGITLVCTSLLLTADPDAESTAMHISTVADTWLHLSYVIKAGERNRALTIVKSRGTKHSNQVRELVLSDAGVTLAEVSTVGGEVLMGTMRWQQEQAEIIAREKARAEFEHRATTLALAEAEARARVDEANREIMRLQAEADLLEVERKAQEVSWAEIGDELRRMRLGKENEDAMYENSAAGTDTADRPQAGE